MSRFYYKSILSNPIYLSTGNRVTWEPVDNHSGVLKTDDALTITELDATIAKRVGGVTPIEESNYEELKKNAKFHKPEPNMFEQQHRIINREVPKSATVDPSAQAAAEQANARPAAGQNPVAVVAAPKQLQSEPNPDAPKPRTRRMRAAVAPGA